MDTYPLGTLPVHRVGFGAMQLPGPGVFGPPRDHDEAIAVLRRAVELGVNHIDTAQYYGPDVANELIREALHPYPDDLVLVSKVGARRDDDGRLAARPATRGAARRRSRTTCAPSGVDRLGAVNLRLMDASTRRRRAGAARGPARRDGRPARRGEDRRHRHLDRDAGPGRAGDRPGRRSSASRTRSACSTRATPTCSTCATTPGSPTCRTSRSGPPSRACRRSPTTRRCGPSPQRLGATPAQVGLAWLLAHRDNILLIPGTSRVAHLEENLDVAEVQLTDDDLAELDASAYEPGLPREHQVADLAAQDLAHHRAGQLVEHDEPAGQGVPRDAAARTMRGPSPGRRRSRPRSSTTAATTVSPRSPPGTPTTATSSIPGMRRSRSSTCDG